MPTVEEIDRLTALLKRLTPLADQQPGEIIQAQDWNVLTDAVMEVARALVEESAAGVPPHEHPDQVSLGWLDPRLRTLVEKGPIGDPAALARVDALERADAGFAAAIAALTQQVVALGDRARDIATRDLERAAAVNVVRRKIDGLADARVDVADVRASLGAVHERVARAVVLAEQLQSGGEPVDLGTLKERVDGLETLRDGLTLPSGERLDAAVLERRLTELRTTLVTQEDLDTALHDHSTRMDPADVLALQTQLQAHLDEEVGQRENALRAEITATTDQRLAGIDGLVAQRLADATPALRDQILTATRAELDARAQAVLTQAGEDAQARVGAGADRLLAELTTQVNGLRGEIPGAVATQLAERLPESLKELSANVQDLRENIQQLERKVAATDGAVGNATASIAEVQRTFTTELQGLRTTVQTSFDDLRRRLDDRVGPLETGLGTLETRVTAIDQSVAGRLEAVATAHDARLRDELAGIARDQLAGFQDRLPELVRGSVEGASATTIRRIAGEAMIERFGPQ